MLGFEEWLIDAKYFSLKGQCIIFRRNKGRINNRGVFGSKYERAQPLLPDGFKSKTLFSTDSDIKITHAEFEIIIKPKNWLIMEPDDAKSELERRLSFIPAQYRADKFGRAF